MSDVSGPERSRGVTASPAMREPARGCTDRQRCCYEFIDVGEGGGGQEHGVDENFPAWIAR